MFTGDRFFVDLDDDQDQDQSNAPPPVTPSPFNVIGEIRERQPSAAPSPPKPPSGSTGFPRHKQRTRQSAFKQKRDQKQSSSSPSSTAAPAAHSGKVTIHENEKRAIGEENERRLASWSESQLEHERAELLESLDSSLLQRFLRRATVDDSESTMSGEDTKNTREEGKERKTDAPDQPSPATAHHQHQDDHPQNHPQPSPASAPIIDDLPPPHPPKDLHPANQPPPPLPPSSLHFPKPPTSSSSQQTPPVLDPTSPSFLSDLQSHYFPNLPHDPSSVLSWLQPPPSDPSDPAAHTSAYHPSSSAEAVHPSAIRFSLLGTILSPSTSLSLPTTLGLHHHGLDPHAAGYTIPEIAILGRSAFAPQRCVAWQVLGRILFRLGKGQFGERGSTLVEGLWEVVEKEGIVGVMLVEADGGGGMGKSGRRGEPPVRGGGLGKHASAAAWAVEGVWLWQMGGGGDRGILKEGTFRSQ